VLLLKKEVDITCSCNGSMATGIREISITTVQSGIMYIINYQAQRNNANKLHERL